MAQGHPGPWLKSAQRPPQGQVWVHWHIHYTIVSKFGCEEVSRAEKLREIASALRVGEHTAGGLMGQGGQGGFQRAGQEIDADGASCADAVKQEAKDFVQAARKQMSAITPPLRFILLLVGRIESL